MTIEKTMQKAGANGEITPAEIRPRLGEAAARSLDAIQEALLDAALSSTRPLWVTHTCPDCGGKHRAEVPVPDVRARVAAIELLLREGLGRAPQSEAPPTPQFPKTAEQVRSMTFAQMQYVFATVYADQIEAVVRDGGERALQERVSQLSQLERKLLLNALASTS